MGRLAPASVLVALVLAAMPASAEAGARCPGTHWVGAWSASPSDADAQSSRSLAGRTSRTVITPLGSGQRVRVHFTNALSTEALEIGAASLARAGRGASIRERSIERLRFNGRRSATIAAGGAIVSDPVRLEVEAFRRLAVSTFVRPTSDGLVTQHSLGRQTSYVSGPGNEVLTTRRGPFIESTRSRYLVSGIEVRAPRGVGAVAAFGDSITDGFQGDGFPSTESPIGIDEDVRYPDFLARRLARREGRGLHVLNAGISGNRILSDGFVPRMGPSGLSRLRGDVLGLAGVRSAIVLEGINDIGLTPAATAAQVIDGLRTMTRRLKDSGLRVILGTLTPAGGTVLPSYGDANANAIRNEVNAWIRSQRVSDGVADFDAALRDPGDPSRMLPAFDSSDHLHPGTAGYRAMAAAVPLRELGAHRCG